ncbi:hypothetical protein CFP65_1345 [Kitasatospora sp. MMS16-BH015]|uniref:hypothetical protein n=1 Tax=Kitasatospora sp. MMS16-BH015 TaxID=2018025 RepID=UPI000CA296D8|nr:hypothetical protein [Kitasatospora sp. MMS16-BH015]AUG76244.1 hypothetical protein CFP65_1345 [Kitasatospora sp. MMS16-BH015]
MPSLLHYEILADPSTLQASADGMPSVATLYLIASNSHQAPVQWESIDVDVRADSGASGLTDDRPQVVASIEPTYLRSFDERPEFDWDKTLQAYRAQSPAPAGRPMTLLGGEALILKLENVPVSRGAGLVQIRIEETSWGGDGSLAYRSAPYRSVLGVVKQIPKVPANFRAERSLLDVDAGQKVLLKWDGPSNLAYWIRHPDGTEEFITGPGTGPVTLDSYSWSTDAPKRGTTYTLIAGTRDGATAQHGYFLTTTVHALIPAFDHGTRSPWVEGTTDRGRVTFTPDGLRVDDTQHALGTVTAKAAVLREVSAHTGAIDTLTAKSVTAEAVTADTVTAKGVTADSAAIDTVTAKSVSADTVTTDALAAKTVTADSATIDRVAADAATIGTATIDTVIAKDVSSDTVTTGAVRGRAADAGRIEFPASGVNVYKNGSQEWGTLAADKADLNGINTKWVQGRSSSDGWIEFPPAGLRVLRDGGQEPGIIGAHQADLDILRTGEARVTGEARIKGLLTAGGGMKLYHEGERLLVTMPDRIVFTAVNEFRRWVTFDRGISVAFGSGTASITQEGGMIVRGGNLQVQQGTLSVSTGNPPNVRQL